MFSFPKLSTFSRPTRRDAGRPKLDSNPINLADYTNPSTPPFPAGWTWCDSMQVWLPEDLPVSSSLLFSNSLPCNRCRPATTRPQSRPKLSQRLTSKEFWTRHREGRRPIKIVKDWFVVQASGATYQQIHLQSIPNTEACCGSSPGGLPQQYLF